MDWQLSDDAQPAARVPASRLADPASTHAAATDARPVPVTGAWRPGDDPGDRRFARIGDLAVEAGGTVADAVLAYETWGRLDERRGNAVLVLHALTGDSHVRGPAGPGHATAGWWEDVVGPGLAIDTDRFFVVAPNMLGGCQGSTGPASLDHDGVEWGSRFPRVTIRDQVEAQRRLADALGIERWHAVVGGSMGGMHALEWAIEHPERVGSAALLASNAATSADQIAQNTLQIEAVTTDPGWLGGDFYDLPGHAGPARGLALARRMAMLGYRSPHELNERFRREWQSSVDPLHGGRFQVESYLDVHGNRFTRRFDAGSYVRLVDAMSTHDVGRGRGGVEAALERVTSPALVVGITSDRLFPVADQQRLAAGLPTSVSGPEPVVLESGFGHDAFLIESRRVGDLLATLLG
ncbi:homoserine O-acetyltransferase [Agrococcus lahaulensis]|uniref:homoserine O-acetyltransferase MetX n=1 Tax=Agrococcus sp. BE272 TaxID=2817727 RepID=UPI000FE2FCF6|nr:homoserine O-acetyltransferase [Agrococcus sp. BE272]MDR7234345.1 homoserine O-acetyltransferase [Agrococcus sp. BE272]RWR23765.1 homoserine O-acetyltransferase [Agrococcus lahaulensis]